MSISCSKCQRVLGKEILGCDQLKSGNCSYQISTKATAGFMKKSFALSWLFLGFGILFFTYFFSEPDAEYSAKFLVFESLLTTFLYLIGIASILIGYFSLNLKKTCIYNPITMDNCTFYFAGAVEFYSKIISNWENINIKLKPILNIDEFAIGGLFYSNNWSLKDFEKLDINNLTSVQKILVDYYKLLIIGLIKSGKVTASVAEVYCAKSQQLENIEDQKTLFLKPNIKNTKDQSISNSIIALLIACIREEQHTKSITLEDLFSELFSCKSNIDAAYKMLKKEVGRYKEIIPKLISEFKRNEKIFAEFEREHYEGLKILLRDLFRAFSPQKSNIDIFLNRYLLTNYGLKQLRIAFVLLAFIGFGLLRYYLPLKKIDNTASTIKTAYYDSKEKINQFLEESRIVEKSSDYFDESLREIDQIKSIINKITSEITLDVFKKQANKDYGTAKELILDYKDAILEALNSQKVDLELQALELLDRLKKEASFANEDVFKLLDSSNPEVVEKALGILGATTYSPARVVPKLETLRQSQNLNIKYEADRVLRIYKKLN